VLLIADGDNVTAGTPTVEGAKVIAISRGEGKSRKVVVFHYKPKKRYRQKNGHRQHYTRLAIDQIVEPQAAKSKSERKPRRKKEATEDGA
jgi:large subunit ribosomal protein L21